MTGMNWERPSLVILVAAFFALVLILLHQAPVIVK
jgi:hypothetical protein